MCVFNPLYFPRFYVYLMLFSYSLSRFESSTLPFLSLSLYLSQILSSKFWISRQPMSSTGAKVAGGTL